MRTLRPGRRPPSRAGSNRREVAISAPDVNAAPVAGRGRGAARADRRRPARLRRAQSYRVAKDGKVAELRVPLAGDGTDSRSEAALAKLRDTLIPATVGAVPGAKAQVGGPTAALGRLQRPARRTRAVGLRLRPRDGVPAAAGQLPLAGDPADRDRAQPALGRRRLRHRRLGLPGRPPGRSARLPLDRVDHLMAAAVPLRRPLRAVDGLPRVHPHPDPGGVRSRHVHRGGRLPRPADDRRAWSPARPR